MGTFFVPKGVFFITKGSFLGAMVGLTTRGRLMVTFGLAGLNFVMMDCPMVALISSCSCLALSTSTNVCLYFILIGVEEIVIKGLISTEALTIARDRGPLIRAHFQIQPTVQVSWVLVVASARSDRVL